MCEKVAGVIICRRGSHRRRGQLCEDCGVTPATLQCDGPHPTNRGKTCDRHICAGCAIPGGPNIDYCRAHATPASRRLAL